LSKVISDFKMRFFEFMESQIYEKKAQYAVIRNEPKIHDWCFSQITKLFFPN